MKNLIIPIDHLVMLAELDDKEAGQMAKAIAQYSKLSSLCFAPTSMRSVSLLQNAAKSIRPMPWAKSLLQKRRSSRK